MVNVWKGMGGAKRLTPYRKKTNKRKVYEMGFIRKEIPPPPVKEGEILRAEIVDLKWPEEGKYGKQVKFTMQLDSGYQTQIWHKYYEHPSERSVIGMLLQTLMDLLAVEYQDVNEALEGLRKYGRLYIKCVGFREWPEGSGILFPRFKVVPTKLPSKQKQQTIGFEEKKSAVEKQKELKKYTIDEVRERTKGWPKEDVEAWIQKLKDEGRLLQGNL